MMSNEFVEDAVRKMIANMYKKDKMYLCTFNVQGRDYQCIFPDTTYSTGVDDYGVRAHNPRPVPDNIMVRCVNFNFLDTILESEYVKEMPYIEAKMNGMYVLPQIVGDKK